jgi:hypothetical protein
MGFLNAMGPERIGYAVLRRVNKGYNLPAS